MYLAKFPICDPKAAFGCDVGWVRAQGPLTPSSLLRWVVVCFVDLAGVSRYDKAVSMLHQRQMRKDDGWRGERRRGDMWFLHVPRFSEDAIEWCPLASEIA